MRKDAYNIKNIFSTIIVILFITQLLLSVHVFSLSNNQRNLYGLQSLNTFSQIKRFNLTYDILVHGGNYVNSYMKILDPNYGKTFEPVYRVGLYIVKEPDIEVGANYTTLLLNQTPACIVLTNNTVKMSINLINNKMKILLALNKAYLICNIEPWFQYKGNVSLNTIKYFGKDYSLYTGFTDKVIIQSEFVVNAGKWALFKNGVYIGDIIFMISKDELGLNSTILLLRHTSTVTCTVNNTVYPSSVLIYVNYTKHPSKDFILNTIKVDRINIGLGDHFKPVLNNIRIINPPIELVRHWMELARKYSLAFIDYGNNTYDVLNTNFSRTYNVISRLRYWSLKYTTSSIIRSNGMVFYRFKPFISIGNVSYCVVPYEHNLSISYSILNGVMLEMNFSGRIPTLTNRTILIPPDILLHGLGVGAIVYPYNTTLSIRLSKASFNLQGNVELGSYTYINLNIHDIVIFTTIIVVLAIIIVLLLLLAKIKKGSRFE